MLSYIASALVATTVLATHEDPAYSGLPLDYSQGGANWEYNCPNAAQSQSQSPIDVTRTVMDKKMMYKIEGMEHWGAAYAPPTPTDNRASVGPDYSFETIFLDFPAPNAAPAEWATHTALHLDAPWPIGMRSGSNALAQQWFTPSQHTYYGNHYDVELHFVFGEGLDPSTLLNLVIHFDRHHGEMGAMDNPFITSVLDAWKTRDMEGEYKTPMDFGLLAHQLMDA